MQPAQATQQREDTAARIAEGVPMECAAGVWGRDPMREAAAADHEMLPLAEELDFSRIAFTEDADEDEDEDASIVLSFYLGSEEDAELLVRQIAHLRQIREHADTSFPFAKRTIARFCDAADRASLYVGQASDYANRLAPHQQTDVAEALKQLQKSIASGAALVDEMQSQSKAIWFAFGSKFREQLAGGAAQIETALNRLMTMLGVTGSNGIEGLASELAAAHLNHRCSASERRQALIQYLGSEPVAEQFETQLQTLQDTKKRENVFPYAGKRVQKMLGKLCDAADLAGLCIDAAVAVTKSGAVTDDDAIGRSLLALFQPAENANQMIVRLRSKDRATWTTFGEKYHNEVTDAAMQIEALARDLWAALVLKGNLPIMDIPSIAESQSDTSSSREETDDHNRVHSLQDQALPSPTAARAKGCSLEEPSRNEETRAMLGTYLGSEEAVDRFCDALLTLRRIIPQLHLPARLAQHAVSKFADSVDLAISCLDVATDNATVLQDANRQVIADALSRLQQATEHGLQTAQELVEIPKMRWLVALRRYCDSLADVTVQIETASRGLAVVISTLRIRGSLRPGAGEGPR